MHRTRNESAPTPDADDARAQAQQIVALFQGLRRHVLRRSRAELARSGLTGNQLNLVSLLGRSGPRTLGELSQELELSQSTVSGMVDRLQARGVVERTTSADDRRVTRVSLTEALSRQARALVDSGPGARLVEVLAAATPEERQTMYDGLALFRQCLNTAWGET
jgi:MarR family transcriptional regulator, organic hydroperoxide resistance regulator